MMNKKKINYTSKVYNGITFKSLLEISCYKHLKSIGIEAPYEPKSILLVEGFNPSTNLYIKPLKSGHKNIIKLNNTKIRNIEYTPDFIIEDYKGYTIFIECKGYPNDRYPLVRKLFLKKLETYPNKDKILFFEPQDNKDFIFMKQILQNL